MKPETHNLREAPNLLNQVSLVTYPKISVTSTNTYNAAGALLRSTTQQGQRPYYDEAFSYSRGGMITDKFFTQDGESRHETYGYDQAARLTVSREHTWNGVWIDNMHFDYDAAGNRMQTRRSPTDVNFYVIDYTHTPGTNQLTRVSDVSIVNGVAAGNPTFDDVLTYDPDGSMISRTIGFRLQVSGVRYSRIEMSPCNEAVPLRRSRPSVAKLPPCGEAAPPRRSRPSAAKLPLCGVAAPPRRSRMALAWVYTLVGADGRQLATYNGLQGSMCGRNGVRLWPVEFNTYGPNNTRIITRADGTSEVVISDYLGSARVTLSTTAEPLQSSSYHPYGTERSSTGSGARTSYIGREHDKETDLGFYGVRLYEPEYGRFLSTDVLWGKFLSLQTYQYCRNNPIARTDRTGMADFFDENGKLAGTDGVDDGYKFIGNREVYNEAIAAGVNWEMMGGQQGIYQLPSAQVLNEIDNNVLGPVKGKSNDDTRREYGGVVGDNGIYYPAPPGPVATGESQYPEINLGPAEAAAKKAGANVATYVHSHVNFDLNSSSTSMKGTGNPSADDRKMLNPTKVMQYGILLYPKFPWRISSVVFFGANQTNVKGTKTDVATSLETVKKIVTEGGK